jgi:GDP-4-dehydro-6-deoxy-D-mannose reductase
MQGMTIAINGSTGQIGSQLTFKHISIDSRLEDPNKDITKNFREIKPDCFIHFASMTDVKKCENNKFLANYLNNVCAVKFFKVAAEQKVDKFIFISTSHVYQPTRSLKYLDVNAKKLPNSYYGVTKLRAEKNLIKTAKSTNTKLVIVRLFSVVSPLPREGCLMHGINRRINEEDFSPIPGLNKVRDFISTNDLSVKINKLAMMDSPPAIVNICSGKPESVRTKFEEMFSKSNLNLNKIKEKDQIKDYLVGLPTKF